MAIDFPIAPVLDDSFTADGKTWYWDGEKWIFAPATPETISAVSPITYESITQTIGIEEDRLISFVTSATRPATPVDGQIIFETDTALYFGWNGTEWTSIGGGGASYSSTAPENAQIGELWVDSDAAAATLNENDFLLKADAAALYIPVGGVNTDEVLLQSTMGVM